MQLWTEYEGVTIDGVFTLRKLLMPEGRSAFFSTAGAKGEPTVVRLIECHFDEDEILARWRSVEALNHPNFLKFERFGQTELDGRPVVYAVFEKVDGNLAEVLDQGRLEVKDVAQLASSVTAALDVLHTHGFVHEHVEPRNIFAKDSVVKLRGDCIREAPEGQEGRMAKQRDVRDLATVLLLALTQRRSLEGVPDAAIPAPFGQIIRKGMDGTWGLEQIRAAVKEHFGAEPAAPAKAVTAKADMPASKASTTKSLDGSEAGKNGARQTIGRQSNQPPNDKARGTGLSGAARGKAAWEHPPDENESLWVRYRWVGLGVAALLLLGMIWAFARGGDQHGQKAAQSAGASQGAGSRQALSEQGAAQRATPEQPEVSAPAASADVAAASQPAAAESHAGWRVIAYTYNRRADAEKRVSDLAHTHPELAPTVFTPSGHRPFLVSVGGVMDRETARALSRRARSLGLPRDTYAQNYSH